LDLVDHEPARHGVAGLPRHALMQATQPQTLL